MMLVVPPCHDVHSLSSRHLGNSAGGVKIQYSDTRTTISHSAQRSCAGGWSSEFAAFLLRCSRYCLLPYCSVAMTCNFFFFFFF